jgi:two-component system NtrC family sensor kinase
MLCDCNQLVADAAKVLQSEFSKRLIELCRNLDSRVPQTAADPKRLEQVLVNILLNSAQAIGTKGTITIATKRLQNEVQITVTDTGPGIEPENLSRIFDPFFTTKPVGTGTGLGLSICAGIVNDYGGAMHFSISPKGGLRVLIELPRSI